MNKTELVLGVPISVISWVEARSRIISWAMEHSSRYVCICNVHSVITARESLPFMRAIVHADMSTPDGAPIAWSLRRKGFAAQERINGPDLMWHLCSDAAAAGVKVGFFGSTAETLDLLVRRLKLEFPALDIAYSESPPFRLLSDLEDKLICERIRASEVGIMFVGLGCPKQEIWMQAHKDILPAVMLGVGAAFDFHAGKIGRAPEFMRRFGLEWLHRLCSEPQRLWKRYLFTNSKFLWATALEFVRKS